MIKVTQEDFSVDEVIQSMKNGEIGALAIFNGIVREETDGRRVTRLESQAYKDMALKQLEAVRARAIEEFGVKDVAIIQRIGSFKVSENVLLIVVGSTHSIEAFKACEFILWQIKKGVPIWLKEFTEDGSYRGGDEEHGWE
jgi:molybdopterin synthase catalytic subunit